LEFRSQIAEPRTCRRKDGLQQGRDSGVPTAVLALEAEALWHRAAVDALLVLAFARRFASCHLAGVPFGARAVQFAAA
jgi:hypothetical protein